MADLQSRPYKPNPDVCCEACVFKGGPHALWCEKAKPGDLVTGNVVYGDRCLSCGGSRNFKLDGVLQEYCYDCVSPPQQIPRKPEGYACY